MLDLLFGFGARLSRLSYFLGTIALGVVMTASIFAMVMATYHQAPSRSLLSILTWPMIAVGVFFMWLTFNLQSMRVRDIGWDPVCIMSAWIAAILVDGVVAARIPAWSLEGHHGTMVGALLNLVAIVALTFWPSGDRDEWTPSSGSSRSKGVPKRTISAARLAIATKTELWKY